MHLQSITQRIALAIAFLHECLSFIFVKPFEVLPEMLRKTQAVMLFWGLKRTPILRTYRHSMPFPFLGLNH